MSRSVPDSGLCSGFTVAWRTPPLRLCGVFGPAGATLSRLGILSSSCLTIKVHLRVALRVGYQATCSRAHLGIHQPSTSKSLTAANHHASVRPHTLRPLSLHPRTNTPASHLLGKKSWNVYNPANIARVRRDEAAAQAREEADEQRMQEVDAARRLAILRGEIPPPLEDQEPPEEPRRRSHDGHPASSTTRKRKRPGEDDTDFEMRLARERASAGAHATRQLAATGKLSSHSSTTTAPASLVDSTGHITLFTPPSPSRQPREGNAEAARDAARKERELKDQYQMRLVNAAGRDGQGLTDGGPWYAASGSAGGQQEEMPGKDVWGRDDPGRKVRQAARLGASDPLAMMKRGARMVRELERDRKKEVEEREREIRVLEKEERREERRRERKRRRKEEDGDRSGRDREDARRDRSEERSKHRRSRRDSPDRDGSAKQRDRSGRDYQERHRHQSQERETRQHDERERRPHRHDSRGSDGDRKRRPHKDDGESSDRNRERRLHRDEGRYRDRDRDRET